MWQKVEQWVKGHKFLLIFLMVVLFVLAFFWRMLCVRIYEKQDYTKMIESGILYSLKYWPMVEVKYDNGTKTTWFYKLNSNTDGAVQQVKVFGKSTDVAMLEAENNPQQSNQSHDDEITWQYQYESHKNNALYWASLSLDSDISSKLKNQAYRHKPDQWSDFSIAYKLRAKFLGRSQVVPIKNVKVNLYKPLILFCVPGKVNFDVEFETIEPRKSMPENLAETGSIDRDRKPVKSSADGQIEVRTGMIDFNVRLGSKSAYKLNNKSICIKQK